MRISRGPKSLAPPCRECPKCLAEICGTLADVKVNKEDVKYITCPSCHVSLAYETWRGPGPVVLLSLASLWSNLKEDYG